MKAFHYYTTFGLIGVYIVCNIFISFYAPTYLLTLMLHLISVALFVLLIFHAARAFLHSKERLLSIKISVAIVIAFCIGIRILGVFVGERERRSFFSNEISKYQTIVETIIENKERLSGQSEPIGYLVGLKNVYGETNIDGSITIMFPGKENNARNGYLYYNGTDMKKYSNGTSMYYLHDPATSHLYFSLTNNWYEY